MLFVVVAAVSAACARQGSEHTYLQAEDLAATDGFDKNEIVDSASFADTTAMDSPQIQAFFDHTPYNRGSFLGTYTSNGVRASDAVLRASQRYGLNPLVFLVRAEMAQGLLGEQFYPGPPSRVEYAFNCGCPGGGASCDPMLAGFDVQVDCLARQLRASLDAIKANGQTDGGWAPGKEKATIDGAKVTPADDSTAALYQLMPVVGTGSGGNWLFWNIWQKYADAIGYSGAAGMNPQGAWIGDPCKSDATCMTYEGGICATNYPGGMCTATCMTMCPNVDGKVPTFCAAFNNGGYCLPVCNPSVAGSCRDGYVCQANVKNFGDATQTANVCVTQ